MYRFKKVAILLRFEDTFPPIAKNDTKLTKIDNKDHNSRKNINTAQFMSQVKNDSTTVYRSLMFYQYHQLNSHRIN